MRGNLSGRQDLLYPSENNKAYEGPVGSVNYARNYRASYIGAKVAKTGKVYFAVRTKTANHLTAKSKKAMALLGGAGAIYAAIVRDKSAGSLYARLYAMYVALQALGLTDSFRKWVTDRLRSALIAHETQATFAGPGGSIGVDNPWAKFEGTLNVQVSNAIRVKFWTELAANGVEFSVDGLTGVAVTDDLVWGGLTLGNYNVLNIVDAESYMRLGSATGPYIVDGQGNYQVSLTSSITPGGKYFTTTEDPE